MRYARVDWFDVFMIRKTTIALGLIAAGALMIPPQANAAEGANTFTGRYLSARFAARNQDTETASRLFLTVLAEDPKNAVLMRRTFQSLLAHGETGKAVEIARTLVKQNKRAGLANTVIAVDYIRASDFEESAKSLSRASRSRFMGLLVPITEAWSRVGEEKYDDALKALNGLKKRKQFKLFKSFHRALINAAAGRIEAAEKDFRDTMKSREGRSLRVVELFGAFLERNGKADEALKIYAEYLKTDPDNPLVLEAKARALENGAAPKGVADAVDGTAETFYGAASILVPENALDSALIFVQTALYLKPNFPAAQALLGGIHETRNSWVAANKVYDGIDPKTPYGWNARIRMATNLDELDKTDDAAGLLRKLADQHPKRTDALVALGDIYRARKRFADAGEAYSEALTRIPQPRERDWTLYYSRGISYERTNRWQEAEADFLKALEIRPDQPLVMNYLGYSWIEKNLHLKRARGMIEKAVDLRPTDGYIVDSLGWVLYRLGEFEGAVKQLERAVALRPEDPIINDHLGDALWKVGRRLEAGFQWRHSLVLNPTDDLAKILKLKIEGGLDAAPKSNGD